MSEQFEKDIISNINLFRKNPKSVQHQLEVLQKGISRLKPDDPFLAEIIPFIKTIPSIPSMQQVVINKTLCDIAANELKKYVKNENNYNSYMIGNELKGIVPDDILGQQPALIADNGADEAETIVSKLLLNRLDKNKKGRKILLGQDYNIIGVASTRHNDENYYVIIFANGAIKLDGEITLSVKEKEYKDNYQYYESKFIINKRKQAVVQHKRHGEIGGIIQAKPSEDAQIYENKTTLTLKEAKNIENVNNAFYMISPKKKGFQSKFNFDIKNIKTNERKNENDNKVELKKIKIEIKKDKKEEPKKVELKKEKKLVIEKVEEKKKEPEKKIEQKEKVENVSGDKSIRRRFFKAKK